MYFILIVLPNFLKTENANNKKCKKQIESHLYCNVREEKKYTLPIKKNQHHYFSATFCVLSIGNYCLFKNSVSGNTFLDKAFKEEGCIRGGGQQNIIFKTQYRKYLIAFNVCHEAIFFVFTHKGQKYSKEQQNV